MKGRDAAALALVGWYLMYPPVTSGGKSLAIAPLSDWRSRASFDTAQDCETLRLGVRRDAKDLSPASGINELDQGIEWAQCVASDDVRLKPK